jgi:glutathione S-transferase
VAFDEIRVPLRRSRRPEIEALSGQHHVPVLVIDGEVICDSHRIVEHLGYRAARGVAAGTAVQARPPAA